MEHMPQRLRCGATLNAHGNWVETLQHDENYMYSGSQAELVNYHLFIITKNLLIITRSSSPKTC